MDHDELVRKVAATGATFPETASALIAELSRKASDAAALLGSEVSARPYIDTSNNVIYDPKLIAELAAELSVPAEVLVALGTFNHHEAVAAAAIYRRAHDDPFLTGFDGEPGNAGYSRWPAPDPDRISAAKLFNAIERRQGEAWKQAGIGDNGFIPADDPRFDAVKKVNAEYGRELQAWRERFDVPKVAVCPGWEGQRPEQEIKSVADLVEYLRKTLLFLRNYGIEPAAKILADIAFDDGAKAFRNVDRVLDHLGENRPMPWPDDPTDIRTAERALSEAIRALQAETSDKGTATPAAAPAGPVQAEPPKPAKNRKGKNNKNGSASPGNSQALIVAGLLQHHRYKARDGELNLTPVVVRGFALKNGVSMGRVSEFFKAELGNYDAYKRTCRDVNNLRMFLAKIDGKVSTKTIFALRGDAQKSGAFSNDDADE